MLNLLVAVDGSDNAQRAARYVATLAREGLAIRAVLCNVQAPVMAGEVGVVAPAEITERSHSLAAAAAFAEASAVLEDSGALVLRHEAEGDAASEIVAAAQAHDCDGIVVGRRGLGKLASLVGGSVSSQVIRSSPIPVTIVP